jgi:exopolysaccharide production protein ExoQ
MSGLSLRTGEKSAIPLLPLLALMAAIAVGAGALVVRAPLVAALLLAGGIGLVVLTSLTTQARSHRAALFLCGCVIAYPAFLPRRQAETLDTVMTLRASVQAVILLTIAMIAIWLWISTPGTLSVFARGRIGLLAWYCGVVLVSLLYTPDFRWAAFAALKLFGPVLVLAVLAALVQTRAQLERVIDVMLIGIAVVLLVYWIDIVTGVAVTDTTARLSTLWLHPNHAGVFASVFTAVMVGRLFTATTRRALLIAGIGAAFGAVSIFMIGSKTGIIAGGVGVALIVLICLWHRPASAIPTLLVAGAGVALISVYFLTSDVGIFAHMRAYDESDYRSTADLTGRVPVWEIALRQGLERPVFGHGYMATFATGFDNGQFWLAKQAHNVFVQTFFDLGLVGVVIVVAIYAAAWVAVIRMALRKTLAGELWPLNVGMFGALAVVTTNSFSEDIFGGIFEARTMLFLLIVFAIFQSATLARQAAQQKGR